MTQVTLIPILSDNYCYLLQSGNVSAIIDPGEGEPVIKTLEKLNIRPDYILNTHHHGDHIAGNTAIKEKYGAKLIAPASEKERIAHIDQDVSEGDYFTIGDEEIHVFETPGHTSGHICFWLPHSRILFCGDLLFSMGCGRAFEGTAEDLYHSIGKIKSLPPETKIYCGHEYTLSNAEFCLSVEPNNEDLKERYAQVKTLRNQGKPTIPTSLALELKTNVFLRAKNAAHFAEMRSQKDKF